MTGNSDVEIDIYMRDHTTLCRYSQEEEEEEEEERNDHVSIQKLTYIP